MSELRAGGRGEYKLQGRVAVVAGGSSGIGAATAVRLADAGAQVIVGYNNGRERAETLVSQLAGKGHMALNLSMENSAAIGAAVDRIRPRFGRVDVLINSAGITRAIAHADLDGLSDDIFDRILTTNVRGPFSTVRAFAPLLRASGDGVIVNVSSISGTTGLGSSIAYCASKAALDTMGLSLARVLAPEVRVLTVSPAAVATDFVPGRDRAALEKQATSTPLKIVAEPDDVALSILAAITHLRLTTGSAVVIDGGRHL